MVVAPSRLEIRPPPTRRYVPDLRDKLESALGDTYAIERELGGGGMSRVFVAEERTLGRKVVIKVLPEGFGAALSVERFKREMQLAAKLQHPQIVPVLAAGEIGGIPYYTMPYINGESLRARLERQGEMPINEAVRIMRQVAAAMSYAHRNGVVHRDIKPDNVLLSEDFAVVTDFGVAKALNASALTGESPALTSVGTALGTPTYMAPEQGFADATTDHRADIYAFGVMAYEMLTGYPPFAGRSAQSLIAAHAIEKPEPIEKRRAGLPPSLAALIMKCLEKRAADRPQTAADLLRVLDSVVSTGETAATPVPVATANGAPRPRAMALAGTFAVLIVAVAYFALARTRTPAGADATNELRSIAVLPLANIGGDSADEYFSDGMTDELSNALAKLPGLRIASRTSAYSFRKRGDADLGEIGRKLNVDAVLEGAVRRSGNRLRVSAQLTKVSDGLSLWSDTYERQTRDVFQVQDDIAQAISAALRLRLTTSAANVSSTSRGTENLAAYDLYLRGRYFWNRRGADNLRRSISYFNAAIARDPRFARAYAALAIAYALLPEYTDSPPADVGERTKAAANRALSLDSTLAEVYAAMGLASVHAWEFRDAESAYRRAITLEPDYATAHQWYGELLFQTNRSDSAIAELRTALALDPLAPIIPSALGYALVLAGRYDEAIAVLKKAIEVTPSLGLHHLGIAQAYVMKSDFPHAIAEMDTAITLDTEVNARWGQLAYVYGKSGMRDKAQDVLRRLEQDAKTKKVSPESFALAYLGLGDNEKALDYLERSVQVHDIALLTSFSPLDKVFDPLRSDPRFTRILERMHLSEYATRR